MVSFTLRKLYSQVRNFRFLLTGDCVGRQNKSERFGEHINLLLIPGIEPRFLGRPIHSLSSADSFHATSDFWFTELSLFRRIFSYILSYSRDKRNIISVFACEFLSGREETNYNLCLLWREKFIRSLFVYIRQSIKRIRSLVPRQISLEQAF